MTGRRKANMAAFGFGRWRYLYEKLFGVEVFLLALGWLIILLSIGTVAQAVMPPETARQVFFHHAWIWVAGLAPLPGLPLTLGFISLGLLVQLGRYPLTVARLGGWLAHAGVLLLVISGLATLVGSRSGYIILTEKQASRLWQTEAGHETEDPESWPAMGILPFSLTLEEFSRLNHPGTEIPSAFSSTFRIVPDNGPSEVAKLILNHPLHYHGYTLYQASYIEKQGQPTRSVIAVVQNPARLLPYLATFILVLGMFVNILQRSRRLIPLLMLMCCIGFPVMAQDLKEFATLPIQHDGRIKPLGTVAHVVMPYVTGRSMRQMDSERELTRWLLAPGSLNDVPQMIVSRALQNQLKFPRMPGDTYTVMQVMKALAPQAVALGNLEAQSVETLAPEERELLELAQRLETALMLGHTFTLLQPSFEIKNPLAGRLGLKPGIVNAMQILGRRGTLLSLVAEPVNEKKLTTEHREALEIVRRLRDMRIEQPNILIKVIPAATPNGEWLSPWEAAQPDARLTQIQATVLNAWTKLVESYPDTASSRWREGLGVLSEKSVTQISPWRLQLEQLNLHYPLSLWVLVPLGLSMIFLMGHLPRLGFRYSRVGIMSCVAAAWLMMSAALIIRILILMRPPVATLYESLLFVTWVILALGLVLRRRQAACLVASAISALLIGVSWLVEGNGDTMGVLVAVLDTRLWLIVHVLTITAGYGVSLVMGYVSYYALWQISRGYPQRQRRTVWQWLHHLTLCALMLTAAGTLLGGIWADQSWGRFWGWDPKENGALILTLWLAGLTHARLLRPVPVVALLAAMGLTPVIVALSWFGVNLLNVGLHSYGFLHGLAFALAGLCLVSGLSIGWLTYVAHCSAREERNL